LDLPPQFGAQINRNDVSTKKVGRPFAMVDLDNECCIGCGACADLCPEVFEMDERSRRARVIIFEVTDRNCIDEAIATCPVECISWKAG